MPATETVRARIDPELKAQAEAVLSDLGLTSSDVIRMLMTRIAKDKAIPLPLKVPNADLREAGGSRGDRGQAIRNTLCYGEGIDEWARRSQRWLSARIFRGRVASHPGSVRTGID